MKIWKMSDHDWCAAETLQEAKQVLADQINDGVVDKDFEDEYLDEPHALTDAEMDSVKFTDEDEIGLAMAKHDDDKTGEEWKARVELVKEKSPSIRQVLQERIKAGQKFPQYFAGCE